MFRFVDRLDAGIIHVNSPTVGGEAHIPFGGMKATGVGLREMGRVAIDFYTELKVVYVDYTGGVRKTEPVLSVTRCRRPDSAGPGDNEAASLGPGRVQPRRTFREHLPCHY